MKATTMVLIAALLAPAAGAAHEGGLDARGTVKEVTPERLVLATADGEKTFSLGADTRFARGREPARREDVLVGDRAVVHARRDGERVHATNVRLAPSGSGAKEETRLLLDLDRRQAASGLGLTEPAPLLPSEGSGGGEGGHGGSHVGPMWIVMGVMMGVMMVAAGFYMMRGNGTAADAGVALSPVHHSALPPAAPHRPGG